MEPNEITKIFCRRKAALCSQRGFFVFCRRGAFAVLALVASLLFAASASALPYGGRNVDDDPAAARFLYPDALKKVFDGRGVEAALSSPTLDRMTRGAPDASDEPGDEARATTHEEMTAFIDALPDDYLRVLTLGTFPSYPGAGEEARSFDLPVLIFSKPPCYDARALASLGKPIVYAQAQIHGDEPSGCDALLSVASALARDEGGLLDRISVILVPRFNVDGAWKNRRGTGTPDGEIDANRDATAALSPLTRAVRGLLASYRPHVFVDLHEMGFEYWGGGEYADDGEPTGGHRYYFDFDLATLVAHPANVHPGVTALARELEAGVSRDLAAAGLRTSRYAYPAETPDYRAGRVDGLRVLLPDGTTMPGYATYPAVLAEGMPDECMFDSAMALAPSVSLLFEARSPGVLTNFRTRVRAHSEAVASVLRQVAARPEIFLEATARGAGGGDDVVLWARQRAERGGSISVLELDDRKTAARERTLPIDIVYGNEGLVPVKTVSRPHAYLISADAREAGAIASRVALTGAVIYRLTEAVSAEVEAYTVRRVATADDEALSHAARSGDYFSSWSPLTHAIAEVSTEKNFFEYPAGTYLFYAADPSATLAALAVEPLANRSLGNYWYAQRSANGGTRGLIPVAVGGEYPVYRHNEKKFFPAVPVSTEAPMLRGAYVAEVVPLSPCDVPPDSVLAYGFLARHPAEKAEKEGGVPDAFEMTVPGEYGGKKLAWRLFDWTTQTYRPTSKKTERGVETIRVSGAHISPDGEVRAVAAYEFF